MKKFKFIISLVLAIAIGSCSEAPKEISENKIGSVVASVAKKYGYDISYTLMPSADQPDSVSISVRNLMAYNATAGAILEECYAGWTKNGVVFKRYSMKNNIGMTGITVTKEELEKAIECKFVAFAAVRALALRDYESLIPLLDSVPFTPTQIKLTKQLAEERLHGNVTEIGFEVAVHNNELYGGYMAIVDSSLASVTINLTKGKCKVFGLNF